MERLAVGEDTTIGMHLKLNDKTDVQDEKNGFVFDGCRIDWECNGSKGL